MPCCPDLQQFMHHHRICLWTRLIKFKGQVQFRLFLPLKRSRFTLKDFVMADSATGYVLNTMVYTGKEGPVASRDLAMRVVLQLMEPYVNKGYRLFVDN